MEQYALKYLQERPSLYVDMVKNMPPQERSLEVVGWFVNNKKQYYSLIAISKLTNRELEYWLDEDMMKAMSDAARDVDLDPDYYLDHFWSLADDPFVLYYFVECGLPITEKIEKALMQAEVSVSMPDSIIPKVRNHPKLLLFSIGDGEMYPTTCNALPNGDYEPDCFEVAGDGKFAARELEIALRENNKPFLEILPTTWLNFKEVTDLLGKIIDDYDNLDFPLLKQFRKGLQ